MVEYILSYIYIYTTATMIIMCCCYQQTSELCIYSRHINTCLHVFIVQHVQNIHIYYVFGVHTKSTIFSSHIQCESMSVFCCCMEGPHSGQPPGMSGSTCMHTAYIHTYDYFVYILQTCASDNINHPYAQRYHMRRNFCYAILNMFRFSTYEITRIEEAYWCATNLFIVHTLFRP